MTETGGEQVQYRVVEDPAQRFGIEQTRMNLQAGLRCYVLSWGGS